MNTCLLYVTNARSLDYENISIFQEQATLPVLEIFRCSCSYLCIYNSLGTRIMALAFARLFLKVSLKRVVNGSLITSEFCANHPCSNNKGEALFFSFHYW